jgi:hypothetical protein
VASQAELLSVNSQLEYLDEQKFGNDTTALLEVEGQASLSDCNVLTSGPYGMQSFELLWNFAFFSEQSYWFGMFL